MSMVEEFLDHHGVKGMHWGIRNRSKRNKPNQGRTGLTTFSKHPHRLSDVELSKRIKRLELEKKYKDLNSPVKSKGKAYVHSLLESSGRTVAGAAVGGAAGFFIQKALKERFG